MTQIINYSLPLGDRISMRENLIQAFLRETPGTGIGDNASRYPAFFATEAKYVYLFLACDSPANASQRFFSVFVPAYLFDIVFSSVFTITFSKSDAGCLQSGQIKSSGISSPTYS